MRAIVFRLTDEAHLRDLIHPLTRGQITHYHDLGSRQRVVSLPVLVCARLPRPLWDESEAPARDQLAGAGPPGRRAGRCAATL